ncbi:unnamed protein product, partial [Symbiodinium natans]
FGLGPGADRGLEGGNLRAGLLHVAQRHPGVHQGFGSPEVETRQPAAQGDHPHQLRRGSAWTISRSDTE